MNVSLEFLTASKKTKESFRQDVREIEHLVTSILEAARLRAPGATLHRAEVDLVEIIIGTVRFYEHQRPGVKIMDLAGDLRCQADKDLIVIVIRNLITNALKYSEGSTRPVEISAYAEPSRVALRITDFGEGISAVDLPHIFEPFYRVDKSRARSTGGYGLGLSLCKAIIDAHDGEIKVESAFGKGTAVTAFLPTTTPENKR
jgi:signal transduction histidine kinase